MNTQTQTEKMSLMTTKIINHRRKVAPFYIHFAHRLYKPRSIGLGLLILRLSYRIVDNQLL